MNKLITTLCLHMIPFLVFTQSMDQIESFYHHKAKVKNELSRKLLESQNTVRPNQEMYDVHFYSLDISVLPDIQRIKGSVMVCATVLSDLDSMELNFSRTNNVHQVYLAEYPDSALNFQHVAGGILSIQLDKTYPKEEEVKILVDYTAAGLNFGLHFKKYRGSDMVFSSLAARDWFPCKDDPGDKADSTDMKVSVPNDLVVASNGLLAEVSQTDTTSTYLWQERYPIAPYLMSISVYPYEIRTDWYVNNSGDSLEIQMFTIPEVYEQVKDLYALEKEMLTFFEEHFGPYPFFLEKYGHTEIDLTISWEMQTITSFSISNLLGELPEVLISHELAHSWMGASVTNQSFHHIWILEGFATYATVMWYEYQEYEEDIRNIIMEMLEYYGPGTPFVEDPDRQDIFDGNLSYNKAAWVYHMLRHMVGDTVFFDIIKAITSDPDCAYGTITTDRFREISEEVSGLKLEKYFQQWIFGERYPDYAYSWSFSEEEPGYELELTLHQVQESQLFWMPVDVAVQTSGGVEHFVVWDSLETQVFHLSLNDMPQSLELDPDNWLLNKVTDISVHAATRKLESKILVAPNPFRNTVEITFELGHPSEVELLIFNELGQEVARLSKGFRHTGSHSVTWNAEGEEAGIYFFQLKTREATYSGKLLRTK